MKKIFLFIVLTLTLHGCGDRQKSSISESVDSPVFCENVLPITGTFLNLPYQDVRNKYTNPLCTQSVDPLFWKSKVRQMKKMGIEFLVLMSVANEQKAYYPSSLMDWHYDNGAQSPVDAIMDEAAANDMKVFMSTGWAYDQDDNLRIPAIKQRQIDMMVELAALYKNHSAMYGWYLPVEDCLGPVLTDYAVEAVNALTDKARELTPGKKVLISPYGIFNSDFDDPRYEQQICRLKVDIIAYQDEVGCVREAYPMTRLRENWKRLRAIHDNAGIQLWANCESFAWEGNTNDRTSALVPASFNRLLSQQVAASAAGVERIISFMMNGIYENPQAEYLLGQPHWSGVAYEDYMAWLNSDRYWSVVEAALCGKYGAVALEDPNDQLWNKYDAGYNEISLPEYEGNLESLLIRTLNCRKDGILPPQKFALYGMDESGCSRLLKLVDAPYFPNNRHDAYVDCVVVEGLTEFCQYKNIRVVFYNENTTLIDRIIVNP